MKKSKHIFILLQRYFDAQLNFFFNNDESVKGGALNYPLQYEPLYKNKPIISFISFTDYLNTF